MTRFRQFGAITKIEDQDDGSIKVWGVASSETRDQQGETITAAAMKAALPDYGRFPALREMHEPSAAGRVVEAEVDDHGITQICAHVVDPLAITKVRAGVYAGFSIGGKVLKRDTADRSVITALKLVEISLVDSPCNPDAVINMWKADMDYVPSGDEVVAKARALAEEAGSRRYKDFLFKARERLIADALASDPGDDEDCDRDAADEDSAGGDDSTADPDGGKPGDQAEQPADAAAAKPRPKSGGEREEAGDGKADADDGDQRAEGARNDDGAPDPDDAGNDANAPSAKPKARTAPAAKDQVKRVAAGGDVSAETAMDGAEADGDGDGDGDGAQGRDQGDAERIQAAHDHLVALGAQCRKENCGDGDRPATDGTVAPTAPADRATDAAKLLYVGRSDDSVAADLAKRFGETIAMLNATISDLAKRLEQVEAEPAAPKTATGPLRAVSKAEDASPNAAGSGSPISADALQKVIDTLPEHERGQLLLRIALANPTIVHAARAAA